MIRKELKYPSFSAAESLFQKMKSMDICSYIKMKVRQIKKNEYLVAFSLNA